MNLSEDRRKSLRANADLAMRLDVTGHAGFARVRDICGAGVRCVTERALAPMTRVELVIALPDGVRTREIVCGGVVVRSGPASDGSDRNGAAETAIFFTEIADQDRVQVEEFVSTIRRSSEL